MAIVISKQILTAKFNASCQVNHCPTIMATGLSFDSRNIKAGQLFIALRGSASDGHQYVAQACKNGAALCLVEDLSACPGELPLERILIVKDSLKSFAALASWWRTTLATPTAAITGSVGKTTVKNLCGHILRACAVTCGTGTVAEKSYNNHTGVPYTLCQLDPEDQYALVEVGMNAAGEVDRLSHLIQPDIGLITGIAPAHIGLFNSIDQIADAKCELIKSLADGAPLLINCDDQVLWRALQRHPETKRVKLLSFGESLNANLRIENTSMHGLAGVNFEVVLHETRCKVSLPLLGKHSIANAAAALLLAHTLFPALQLEHSCKALASALPAPSRMNIFRLADSRTIIDDCYNANPTSLGALLDLAQSCSESFPGIGFILGDMLELGEKSNDFHQQIAKRLVELKPAFVICVGQAAKCFSIEAEKAGINTHQAKHAQHAALLVQQYPFDLLFIKGSRRIGLEKTVAELIKKYKRH